jgi:hypothetical protein
MIPQYVANKQEEILVKVDGSCLSMPQMNFWPGCLDERSVNQNNFLMTLICG